MKGPIGLIPVPKVESRHLWYLISLVWGSNCFGSLKNLKNMQKSIFFTNKNTGQICINLTYRAQKAQTPFLLTYMDSQLNEDHLIFLVWGSSYFGSQDIIYYGRPCARALGQWVDNCSVTKSLRVTSFFHTFLGSPNGYNRLM